MSKNKYYVKAKDNHTQAAERHKIETKIKGMEMTAENAAEMGDMEYYLKLCHQITAEQLKLDFLSRKKQVAVVDESRATIQDY